MFLLSVLFLLLALGKIGKISSGPIEVNDLYLIQLILPAIVAYFTYDAYNLLVRQVALKDMYFSALLVLYPNIASNRLELFLAPGTSSIFGAYPLDDPTGRITRRIMQLFTDIIALVFLAGVGSFQVVAFLINLDDFSSFSSANRVAFIVAETVVAILMIYSVFYLLATPGRDRPIELARLD
jgi:hypothetical protein